jgi:hypothetical protein
VSSSDIIVFASDRVLLVGLRNKPALLRGRPLHPLNSSNITHDVNDRNQLVLQYQHPTTESWPTLFSDALPEDRFTRKATCVVAFKAADALSLSLTVGQIVGILQENVDAYAAEPLVKAQVLVGEPDVGLAPSRCLRTLEADEEAALSQHDAPLVLHGFGYVNSANNYLAYYAANDTLYAFAKEQKLTLTQAVRESATATYRLSAACSVVRDRSKATTTIRKGANFDEISVRCSKVSDSEAWGDVLDRAVARRRWLALFASLDEARDAHDDDWPTRLSAYRDEFVERVASLNKCVRGRRVCVCECRM